MQALPRCSTCAASGWPRPRPPCTRAAASPRRALAGFGSDTQLRRAWHRFGRSGTPSGAYGNPGDDLRYHPERGPTWAVSGYGVCHATLVRHSNPSRRHCITTILVAYVPRPEGRAALDKGIEIAKRRQEPMLIVNASPGGQQEDARWHRVRSRTN